MPTSSEGGGAVSVSRRTLHALGGSTASAFESQLAGPTRSDGGGQKEVFTASRPVAPGAGIKLANAVFPRRAVVVRRQKDAYVGDDARDIVDASISRHWPILITCG